jgi:hypothetical protein
MSAISPVRIDRVGPVSPELALVDPVLRRRLQALELARTPVNLTPPGAANADEPVGDDAPKERLGTTSEPRTISVSLSRTWLTVVAVASAAAFVLGAKLASQTELMPAQATATASLSPPSDLRGTVDRSTRRLTWAPIAGATGYLVAFYDHSDRVFVAHTALPRVELSWAVRQAFPHGSLAWYVWPTHAGLRDSSPS